MSIVGRRAARLGERGRSGAKPEVTRALEDAAVLRREAIGNCPECRSGDERARADHEESREAAGEYESLRWHLDSSSRDGQADQEADAATASGPTGCRKPKEPGVNGDDGDRAGKATTTLEQGKIGHCGSARSEEYVPPAVPDTSRCVPPSVYNAIGDYAREVNQADRGPDGDLYTAPEERALRAKWLADGQAGPGPAEVQIIGWHDTNDYCNEADDYEPDGEAGA